MYFALYSTLVAYVNCRSNGSREYNVFIFKLAIRLNVFVVGKSMMPITKENNFFGGSHVLLIRAM
jgi:hypothetical protein